ncbi:MAG: DUF1934 family protein [Bacilli bacterium]|jgi:hypothetical protein|nr:DUF1934 family protein [Bacilli bacterium]
MAKILVTAVLENKTDNKFFSTETLGILESNKIKFIDENKVTVIIELKENNIVITRRCDDYEIILPFNTNNKTQGTYIVKNLGNLRMEVETTKLLIDNANLDVEYTMILDGETKSDFRYKVIYSENK